MNFKIKGLGIFEILRYAGATGEGENGLQGNLTEEII